MSVPHVPPHEFRHTMGLFATGVTVITVRDGETIHGMTANAVTSVSLDPLLVLVCIDNRARMRELIPLAGRFAINVLSERQQPHSRHFAGRKVDGLEIAFSALDGVPVLPDNLATLVCTVDRVVDGGDHMVVFGRVDALARAAPGARPLVYYAGDYGRIAASARVRRLEARQRERLAALNRITQVVAAGLNVEEVFESFAQGLATLVPHDAVSVTLLGEDGQSLERFALAASPTIAPRVGEAQPLDQTAAGITVRTGKTVVSGDMPGDERFRGENDRRWIDEGFRSFVSAPLRAKGRLIGALNVLSRVPARYGADEVAMVEGIANQIAIFLDNMHLHARLRRLTQIEERQRLAREIHDTLLGALATIVRLLEQASGTPDQERVHADVARAAQLAQSALADGRRSVWALHADGADHTALPDALRAWLAAWQPRGGVTARLFVRGEAAVPPEATTAILRIAQEALRNVDRHAGAREARIELELGADEIRLVVSDDGGGFDPQAPRSADSEGGFGLRSMSERALAAGGSLRVSSWPGNGTRVEATFPGARNGGYVQHRDTETQREHGEKGDDVESNNVSHNTGQAPLQARILLVEDQALVRTALAEMLARVDGLCVVGEAANGQEALAQARLLQPDLVLMDMRLPGMDGAAVTEQLRAALPHLPVIVLTASDAGDDLARAVAAGARGYLLKESPAETLVETIRAVLRGEAAIERRIAHHLVERFNHLMQGQRPGALTVRELEVLQLMVAGKRNRDIARALGVSVYTVKSHAGSIFHKLGVADRAGAVAAALQRNLTGEQHSSGDRA